MAIRRKPGGATSRRGAKAKSSSSGRKKAGARKKKASRKKKAARKQGATRNKGGRKKSARSAAKKSATAERRTGTNSPGPGGQHPATIAKLYPERIGTVLHYYARAGGAVVRLERGRLRVGDAIHVRGHTTDFYERIEELKLDDLGVEMARSGQIVGIRVSRTVRENDGVYLLSQ